MSSGAKSIGNAWKGRKCSAVMRVARPMGGREDAVGGSEYLGLPACLPACLLAALPLLGGEGRGISYVLGFREGKTYCPSH